MSMIYERMSSSTYENGIKIKLIVVSILLLMLALGFNTLLNLNSLEDIYVGSTFSKYSAIGNDLKRNIEKSLRFGKTIDRYFGLNSLLLETREHLTKKNCFSFFKKIELIRAYSNLSVSLALPDNQIYYSTEPSLIHQQLPSEVSTYFKTVFTLDGADENMVKNYYKFNSKFYIGLPIEKNKSQMGTLIIILPEAQVNTFIHNVLIEKLQLAGLILLGGLTVLLIFFFKPISRGSRRKGFSRKEASGAILMVLVLAQILFALLNTNSFKNCYLEITREKTGVVGSLLGEDINFILSKGIALNRIFMMEKTLGEIIMASPELSDIILLDSDLFPLYKADKKGSFVVKKDGEDAFKSVRTTPWPKESQYHQSITLGHSSSGAGDSADIAGYISITISKKVLLSELKKIIMDAIIVLAVSLLFSWYLCSLCFNTWQKR
ncbi:hypothetical protein SAMN02746065_12717 [Desulfocicer vacuolatum DSM 3385]|uniref:Uncharacterized protein n=1 Tax=Desulfocicer vacuolatum DSM 3385 TaxID=1121400 RepID=A0A1W2E9B0_9BACT|nr:hypothetical protein [Desulfocicer vacuolatum]SMD06321.1 hypothetical protein SAMN02746065_12717 [Desulfocicer vacuolatum DSM 3385]